MIIIEIWRFAAVKSCTIQIDHKPDKDLVLADTLSRRPFDSTVVAKADTICHELDLMRVRTTHNFRYHG